MSPTLLKPKCIFIVFMLFISASETDSLRCIMGILSDALFVDELLEKSPAASDVKKVRQADKAPEMKREDVQNQVADICVNEKDSTLSQRSDVSVESNVVLPSVYRPSGTADHSLLDVNLNVSPIEMITVIKPERMSDNKLSVTSREYLWVALICLIILINALFFYMKVEVLQGKIDNLLSFTTQATENRNELMSANGDAENYQNAMRNIVLESPAWTENKVFYFLKMRAEDLRYKDPSGNEIPDYIDDDFLRKIGNKIFEENSLRQDFSEFLTPSLLLKLGQYNKGHEITEGVKAGPKIRRVEVCICKNGVSENTDIQEEKSTDLEEKSTDVQEEKSTEGEKCKTI